MFGIGWLAYFLTALGCTAIVFALLVPNRPAVQDELAARDSVAPAEPQAPAVAQWPSLVGGSRASLPFDARLRMIAGLGTLGERWCGPVLAAAYIEESETELRQAALRALCETRYDDCTQVLAAALDSNNVVERILAVELAETLGAAEFLDQALLDPQLVVATAAAYALKRRLNGSFQAHLEGSVSAERAAQLLERIRVLL